MQKLIASLKRIDDNLIKILLVGFIFFIPLWPKLPLTLIQNTYIGLRVDDIYTAVFYAVFLIQGIRKKITLRYTLWPFFLAYWAIVFLSLLNSLYIQNTVDYAHLGFLHAARRVQYMFVFFIGVASIQSTKDLIFYLRFILYTLGIVTVYGIGQKFWGWPAIQTMNPEYAKGYVLQLAGETRISSTFAGHYDLAVYFVLLIPLLLGYYIYRKQIHSFILYALSLFALTLTSSRVSFGSYILSTLPYLLFMRKFVLLALALLLTIGFTFLSKDLTSRISRTFQAKTVFIDKTSGYEQIAQQISPDELPAGSAAIGQNKKADVSVEEEAFLKKQLSDGLKLQAEMDGKNLSEDELARLVEEAFGRFEAVDKQLIDTSLAVRVEVAWPRAMRAWLFAKPKISHAPEVYQFHLGSFLLGSGPSSIGEATDGGYFRSLGEFGILGTIAFFVLIGQIAWYVWSSIWKKGFEEAPLQYAFLFGMGGVLINATLIDVFEASKFAYTFWTLAGLYVGSCFMLRKQPKQNLSVEPNIKKKSTHKKKKH